MNPQQAAVTRVATAPSVEPKPNNATVTPISPSVVSAEVKRGT